MINTGKAIKILRSGGLNYFAWQSSYLHRFTKQKDLFQMI